MCSVAVLWYVYSSGAIMEDLEWNNTWSLCIDISIQTSLWHISSDILLWYFGNQECNIQLFSGCSVFGWLGELQKEMFWY